MLNALFVLSLIIFSIIVFYFGTKNTFLRLDLKGGYIWPVLIYRELLTVFSGVLLALIYGVGSFEGAIVNAQDEDVFPVALLSVYAVFVFGVVLAVLSKYLAIPNSLELRRVVIEDCRIKRFANAAALIGTLLLLVAALFLSYRHAFLVSILSGESLVAVRLQNAYQSRLPSQVAQVISLSWLIVSVYGGILLYKKKRLLSLLYCLLALFLASARGDKAPVMMSLLLIGFSYYSFRGVQISARAILRSVFLFFPLLYSILFFVVSLQISDLKIETFNVYLLNRIGIGQIAGVFETFSMPRLIGDFYWHMIPGASFFVDYIPYDKMLMMVIEDYGYSEMGVKNSLFISEAYGIGGIPLLMFSPVIVGASYAVGLFLLHVFLTKFFGEAVSVIYTLPLYILSSALTGGFSSFAFFKGLLLVVLCLGVIWIGFQFLRLSLKKPSKKYAIPRLNNVTRSVAD